MTTSRKYQIPCEGSGWPGNDVGGTIMCTMCGATFWGLDDEDDVPDHHRPDIIRMIDDGVFDDR